MSDKPGGPPLFIGTAGWNVPSDLGGEGSHLERYARLLNAVEINSSFHRSHRQTTYARWADATPDGFKFAVKMPKAISHDNRLVNCGALLTKFASEVAGLRDKLGVALLQLPPKQAFEPTVVEAFLNLYDEAFTVPLVIEPRHVSWFDISVDHWLTKRRIARVAADPPIIPSALLPGGWRGMSYFRWHGSPRRYYSSYDAVAVRGLRESLTKCVGPTWCIFDNTAAGAAFADAVTLAE